VLFEGRGEEYEAKLYLTFGKKPMSGETIVIPLRAAGDRANAPAAPPHTQPER
jgi:hypothetical protein